MRDLAAISFLFFAGTLIAFIYYWIKKIIMRYRLGDDYMHYSEYQKLTKKKSTVGYVSLVSMILFFVFVVMDDSPKTAPKTNQNVAMQETKNDSAVNSESQAAEEKKSEIPQVEEKQVAVAPKIKRISIDSLEDISIPQLEKEIIDYVNNNPEERNLMINYVLNLRMIELQQKNPKALSDSTEFIINSIPGAKGIIGGLVGDFFQSDFLDDYKKALVGAATNFKRIQQTIAKSSPNENCREVLLKKYSAENLSPETYNAEMKIAEIMYRGFSAIADESRVRSSLKIIPDIFDFGSDIYHDNFVKPKNIENIKNSREALKNIYSALWVKVENYKEEKDFENFYLTVIPQWLFPYELEQNFSWQNEDDFYIYKKSYTDDYNERIYSIVNAEWTSLADGKTKIFYKNPANEHRIYKTDRINNVYAVAKNVPFVAFDGYIVFPAIHVKKGTRENVLVMYNGYRTLNSDIKAEGLDYIKNLRMDNIGSAGDVLIRSYNPDEKFNHFDDEKFREKYYKEITPNYLLKDNLIPTFMPKEKDYYINNFSEEDKQRIYDTTNGNWYSLISGENQTFYIDPEDANRKKALKFHKLDVLSKYAPSFEFDIGGSRYLITPAIYINDGKYEKVFVMYINYKFVDFNGKSEGFGYAENLRVDNIKSADDVLIKNYDAKFNLTQAEKDKIKQDYHEKVTPNYLLKDKLINAFTPKNEADIRYEIYQHHIEKFSKEDKQRIFGAINGNWHSLINNENHNFYIDPEDKNKKLPIGKFSIIGKSAPFLVFNFAGNPRQFFITPATYMHEGKREKVLVMYVNYRFIDFNGKSEGFGYAENLCVDNIKSADDVLIKVSR